MGVDALDVASFPAKGGRAVMRSLLSSLFFGALSLALGLITENATAALIWGVAAGFWICNLLDELDAR